MRHFTPSLLLLRALNPSTTLRAFLATGALLVSAPAIAEEPAEAAETPVTAPALSQDDVAIRAVIANLVVAGNANDAEEFRAGLTQEFVDLVTRYQGLIAQAPPSARENSSWNAFMRAFAAEHPQVLSVNVDNNVAQAQVMRLGTTGTLLFTRIGTTWKLDVQPALKRRVEQLEARTLVAPDDTVVLPPEHPPVASPVPAAASQPAVAPVVAPVVAPRLPSAAALASDDDVIARAPMPSPAPGPFDPGQPLHYVWYTPDYLFIAGTATLAIFDGYTPLGNALQAAGVPSLIGPSINFDDPDLDQLFDPRLDGVIGKPIVAEKVPASMAALLGVGTVGALALADVRHLDFHHTHAFAVGALTAALGAYSATELGKSVVRRMRPDFRERYTRAACGGVVTRPDGLDCSVTADQFAVDGDFLNDGLQSFPSGHSSFSFAVATYSALYLGGEFIWGQDAGMIATPLAAIGITGMYSVATFIAASRLSDNRHHFEDVAVGSALGAGIATASYFLHFDTKGNARWRGFAISPVAYDEGGGVSVSGRF